MVDSYLDLDGDGIAESLLLGNATNYSGKLALLLKWDGTTWVNDTSFTTASTIS